MSKLPEYEKLKQLADKIYADLIGLSPDVTKEKIIAKYKQWITTYENVFREFSVKSIDDLDELAEEGKQYDKKLDKVYKEKYRYELKKQLSPALDTFKKIRDRFVDFRRDNPHLSELPKWPGNIPIRIAYQELQEWCTSVREEIKTTQTSVKKQKHGKGELNKQVKNLLERYPDMTALELADRIGDTSASAIRQTEAWKENRKRLKEKNK